MVNGVGGSSCVLDGRANWRHLANTVERLYMVAMTGSATSRGGDVACFQITLGSIVTVVYDLLDDST